MKITNAVNAVTCIVLAAALIACERADTDADTNSAATASAPAASPYAGDWSGSWVNTADSTDFGTANWTIDATGAVSGVDNEMKTGSTAQVAGRIDAQGVFSATTTPPDSAAPAMLTGTLTLDAQRSLTGVLHWNGKPPGDYRYSLSPL